MTAQVRDKQLRLPFDQYQRYQMVADVVELLREGSSSLRILDVGGGEGIILNFLPEDQVTVLDRSDAEGVPGLVEGDATALPFEDEAFDYVTSVDVYEHIEPGSREKYLSELRRTARRGVLLAAPFDSDVVCSAERVANEFHRSVHSIENVWLKEHAENGLPQLDDARKFFEGHGDTISILPNGYIPHWLAMICLTFYSSKLEGESSGVFDRVNAFYNEFMYGLDNTEPCYRHLLVSLKEPVDTNLDALISSNPNSERTSQSSALFSTLSAMLPMAAEVKQLNAHLAQHERQLAQKEEELARKEAQSDAQLAEYRKHLAQKEGALARKEAQANDQSRRLAEYRELLAEKEGMLARKEAQSDAQLAEYRKRLAQKEGELVRKGAQVNDLTRRLAERVSAENAYRVRAEQRMAKLQQDHNRLQQDRNNLKQRTDNLERQRDQLQQQFAGVTNSRGWRLLTVLHKVRLGVGRILRSG